MVEFFERRESASNIAAGLLVTALVAAFVGGVFQIEHPALAQEIGTTRHLEPITVAELTGFGLALDDLEPQLNNFDMMISQTVTSNNFAQGEALEIVLTITNKGPVTVHDVFLYNTTPSQLTSIFYDFNTSLKRSSQDPNIWYLGAMPVTRTVVATITGEIDTPCDVTAYNIASVVLVDPEQDNNLANNFAAPSFSVRGAARCLFLPIAMYNPTPTPTNTPTNTPTPTVTPTKTPNPTPVLLFFDNFSTSFGGDNDDEWSFNPADDDDDCVAGIDDERYRVFISEDDDDDDDNEGCWAAAPQQAEYGYGTFLVEATRDEGSGNFAYGLYINDEQGDDFYRLTLYPNSDCNSGGDWELERTIEGERVTILSGQCETAITRGYRANSFGLQHKPNGEVTVFINNRRVGQRIDLLHLTAGVGTGLYVRQEDDSISIKFDDFTVYATQP